MKKLVLHFDINDTIMLGDPAGGVTFEQALNNAIARQAITEKGSGSSTRWHDGSSIDPADRPPGSSPPPLLKDFEFVDERYFKTFRRHPSWPSAKFTEPGMPGEMYRPVFEEMAKRLEWKHDPHPALVEDGHHFLVPAFFHTLRELARQGRDFSVVLRTFGTDGKRAGAALSAFASGEHPDFPIDELSMLPELRLEIEGSHWNVRRVSRDVLQSPITLRRYSPDSESPDYGKDLHSPDKTALVQEITEEAEVAEFFSFHRAVCVRDDYHFWKGHGYLPEAGKPLWITTNDDSVQHIFFDDNIHNQVDDSIVAIRARRSVDATFTSVSGRATAKSEGILLVKVQPVNAVLDADYFLRKIADAEARFAPFVKSDDLFCVQV